MLHQVSDLGAAYNIPLGVRLGGCLDRRSLDLALGDVVRRHEVLRTTIAEKNGRAVQVVGRAEDLPVGFVDLGGLAEAARETESRRLADESATRPFDLARGALLRLTLLRLEAEDHVLLASMHHIVSDGWSIGILFREVVSLYHSHSRGQPSSLPSLPIQYGDYAAWQREWLEGGALETQLGYWRERLAGAPAALELPTDRPRPVNQSFRGASRAFSLSMALSEDLRALSRREDATLFMTLLAALQLLLGRYSGQSDIVVGSPVANRTRAETVNLVGFFLNALVLRTDLSGNPSFGELLARVRETCLGAYAHQDVPFEKLVEALQPARDRSRPPLFQVMLVLQNLPAVEVELPDLKLKPFGGNSSATQFDLSLFVSESESGLQGYLQYSTDLFDDSTIERLLGHFEVLLEGIVADPGRRLSELGLLRETERRQVLVEWNETSAGYPAERCVHELFELRAARIPDAVAVSFHGQQLSYDQLNRRANQVARYLQTLGVGPEVIVGISVERSLEMIAGLLGILKAGGAYVPLDPSYPAERLALMLEDTGVSVVLSHDAGGEWLPAGDRHVICLQTDWPVIGRESDENRATGGVPESLAYVIYTSGSTGTPKGVQVTQRSLLHYPYVAGEGLDLGPGDRVLQFNSLNWDTAGEEIYPSLIRGATLVLRDPELSGSIEEFLDQCCEWQITALNLPTAYWSEIVKAGSLAGRLLGEQLRSLVIGGSEVPARQLRNWQAHVGSRVRLVNTYGTSETSMVTTWCDLPGLAEGSASDRGAPIGRPIANTQVYVLDPDLRPAPIGVPGELFIGGVGLARSYLDRPGLTAARFVPDPFGEVAGERLYRTGDRVCWRDDGQLDYLGRLDQQVKVRGHRIELGEIEACLFDHPAVREAVVVAHEEQPGEPRLVAYYVPIEEAVPGAEATSVADLRSYLKGRLPAYMLPSFYVALADLPLTASGKVDRQSLPAPDGRAELEQAYEAPRTATEEILSGIWSEVLRLDRVGRQDDFFELGGHSLLATQVVSRLREAVGVELPLRAMFESQVLADFAGRVEAARAGGEGLEMPALASVSRDGALALSYGQERLWFLEQLGGLGSAYHIPMAVRLEGLLDVAALTRAVWAIVDRHEALRTRFETVAGAAVQVIDDGGGFFVRHIDLSGLPEAVREAEGGRVGGLEASRRFELSSDPLLRASLLQLDVRDHVVLGVTHHIVSDGWSTVVLVRELTSLYGAYSRGAASPLADLSVQYADYAVWQRGWLEGAVLEAQVGYWRDRLAGAPAVLSLPTDRGRPAVQSFRGASLGFSLSRELSEGLAALSRGAGATLFMTVLAAFQVLLGRYSGQEDVVVGTPVANRRHPATEDLIGFFVNTLALRTDLSGNPGFRELLGRVREVALGAYDHQDLPFEKLVEELQPVRDLSRTPLFQVMLVLQNAPQGPIELPDLTFKSVPAGNTTSKFDLSLYLSESAEGLRGVFEYCTDLFEGSTIERLLDHFQTLLEAIVADPDCRIGELGLLREAERRQVLVEWNETAAAYPRDRCIHELIAEQAAARPEAIAVVFEDQQLSYGALDRRSNQLARYLRGLGVGPEVVVGLCLERSLEMVVGLLGVLKAGGAYLPLDPSYPRDRLGFMVADAACPLLLIQSALGDSLSAPGMELVCLDQVWPSVARCPETAPRIPVGSDTLAYVIYTSGSTGQPKGVMVGHGALVNFLQSMSYEPGMTSDDVLFAVTPLSFDISGLELYLPLIRGGRVVVARREDAADSGSLRSGLETAGATVMQATPATWRMLAETGWRPAAGLKVLCGGEALPADLARVLWDGPSAAWNLYGPTETTVWSTAHALDQDRVLLGRPIANTCVYVVDDYLEPVPIGVAGELYIGGAGVARGYRARSGLTAERFIPDPFSAEPGARLYRTGDLVRYLASGALEFLGRVDHQVKVRGHRIELGEIEARLVDHPAVREAVVVSREDAPGDQRLVGYLVSDDAATSVADLRSHVKGRLPEYMVPSAFVVLEAMPLTPNGKVDRTSLPAPEGRPELEQGYEAPRTTTEEILAGIWAEVLRVDRVGVHDDFFDLGGHSLLATQMIWRVRERLDTELPLRTLFEAPGLAEFAERVAVVRMMQRWHLEPSRQDTRPKGPSDASRRLPDFNLDKPLVGTDEEVIEGEL